MKKQRHSISFFSIMILFAILFNFVLPYNLEVSAADTKKYLSLGDSIAAGYGLKDSANERYANLLTKDLSKRGSTYELLDFAADGMDSSDLLKLLSDASNENLMSALQSASVITVSVGGNNFLKPLTEVFSESDSAANIMGGNTGIQGGMSLDPDQIDESMITFYLNALFSPSTKEYKDLVNALDKACGQFESDLNKIINILTKNKSAKIVFLTVYNPYTDLKKAANFYKVAEDYFAKLNGIIKDKSNNSYIVCDIYTAFDNSTQQVVNASLSQSNFDPHPNAAGHRLIYKSIVHSLGLSLYFDDMANDAWAVEYVDDLHERLIIFGTNAERREFSPKTELKNCDLAVLLARTLKLKTDASDVSGVTLPFTDTAKIPDYALNSVKACYKAGLYNALYPSGKTYAFNPEKSAQRIDVALMAVQLIDKSKWSNKKPVYTDLKDVSESYYPALSTLYDYGIMVGSPNKTLAPFDGLTRAQVAAILWRILNNPELTSSK